MIRGTILFTPDQLRAAGEYIDACRAYRLVVQEGIHRNITAQEDYDDLAQRTEEKREGQTKASEKLQAASAHAFYDTDRQSGSMYEAVLLVLELRGEKEI